ncbi:PaaI family thioesterase [Methylobacterium planeticum]|uniref:PaaI family thioesterase n=1 Tax=Methylobacterium planeticum TaxID=2615211 RepID=A0A6N6MXP4_9HYPH|nr:PaaI family thioesterase [Methylobacterium planeticum]KAB1074844.1 PaaI family thioesterase [Methylobacterium planeticum]
MPAAETPDAPGSDPATPPEDPAGAGWEIVADRGFVDLVGPLYRRPRDGAYAFAAAAKHANLIGVVQGGMMMTFADRALGVTAMAAAEGANCVTIEMQMHFIGVGRIGDWIVAHPRVTQRTGSLVFMRAEVTAGDRLVATATGIWKILRRKPAA